MAVDLREAQFTIPAGTPIANPFTQKFEFPPRVVTQINVNVPAGPNGQMGFAVGSSGVPVIPAVAGTWIVADDDYFVWPLSDYWTSGSWQFFGYNLGAFPHTVYFTFLCDLPAAAAAPPVAPLPAHTLDGTVIVGQSGNPAVPSPIAVPPFVPPDPIPTAAASFAVPAGPGLPVSS